MSYNDAYVYACQLYASEKHPWLKYFHALQYDSSSVNPEI